jgi:2-haloacid dehalogenase
MSPKYSVLFFDVNETLLDLKELKEAVGRALNGNDDVVSLWFETMLHYSLVANAIGEYHNFGDIGAAALVMLANKKDIKLTMAEAQDVLSPIRTVPAYSEVANALKDLKQKGYRLAALTNSSRKGMEAQLKHADIDIYFDQKLSVEDIGIYKPDRHVYRWASQQMRVNPQDCLFVAAHGWDIAGAVSAGMKAAFLNRPGQNRYPLAPKPDYIEPDLEQLASKL